MYTIVDVGVFFVYFFEISVYFFDLTNSSVILWVTFLICKKVAQNTLPLLVEWKDVQVCVSKKYTDISKKYTSVCYK